MHSAHAANLRVQLPWCTTRSRTSERSATPAVSAERLAKKKNAPRETRCTACAPNHAGEGSNPTRAAQGMERSRGSASSRRSTARSVVRAKSVTYSARAEILEMAWPTAPHPAHVAVMHALPAHAANIPPHANIREDERTTRRREARGDVRAV